jgi:ATP-dependent 26S proteasome regulatory subunit
MAQHSCIKSIVRPAMQQWSASFATACTLDEATRHRAAGYDAELQALREVLVWPFVYACEAEKLGLRWPTGCLLHGPPGVGKTTLVKVLTCSCQPRQYQL